MPGRRDVFVLAAEGLAFLFAIYLTDRFGGYVAGGILGVALGLAVIGLGLAGAWEALQESKKTRRRT